LCAIATSPAQPERMASLSVPPVAIADDGLP
jgi:hypothetical protein